MRGSRRHATANRLAIAGFHNTLWAYFDFAARPRRPPTAVWSGPNGILTKSVESRVLKRLEWKYSQSGDLAKGTYRVTTFVGRTPAASAKIIVR